MSSLLGREGSMTEGGFAGFCGGRDDAQQISSGAMAVAPLQLPTAGNSWLAAPLPLQHCRPPRPRGQQLSQQLTGQISVCSIGEADLVVVLTFRIKSCFRIFDGWALCVCVCVFGGGWSRALTCSQMPKTREAAQGQQKLSKLALDGNTSRHSKESRCTFILFKRNNPNPLHARDVLWKKD